MKLDELLGNLNVFEQRWLTGEKKTKSVAFKATKKEKVEDDYENLDLALITKQFKQFMKDKNSSSSKNSINNSDSRRVSNRFDGGSNSRSESNRFNQKNAPTGPKCFTCGAVCHMAADCGNKKYEAANKSLLATWSDEEEQTVAFVCSVRDYSKSDSDENFEEEIDFRCAQMYKASKLLVKRNEALERETEMLRAKREKMEAKFEKLQQAWEEEKSQLEEEIKNLQGSNEETWKPERASLSNEVKEINFLNINLSIDFEILQNKLNEASEKFYQFKLSSDKASQILFTAKRYNDKMGLDWDTRVEIRKRKLARFVPSSLPDQGNQKDIVSQESSSETKKVERGMTLNIRFKFTNYLLLDYLNDYHLD
ncbi:hypothetical protein ACLB2K_072858 [Fragaria x ananassa]